MKPRVSLGIRIFEVILLIVLGYNVYKLFNKTNQEIEAEYKDGKLFIFILLGGFLSTLFVVIRDNLGLFRR